MEETKVAALFYWIGSLSIWIGAYARWDLSGFLISFGLSLVVFVIGKHSAGGAR